MLGYTITIYYELVFIMTNPLDNDDLPQITLDEEDRRGRAKTSAAKVENSKTKSSQHNPADSQVSNSSGKGLATFAVLIALASAGAAGWLFQQLQIQVERANSAEDRIAGLESKLSATGEEIGDTTVALQIKVTELSNKSNELWEQMDKLWASAWRRNQKDITDLTSKVEDQIASLKNNISAVTSSTNINISSVADARSQVENLTSEVLSLNVQLERAAATDASTRRDLQNTTEKLSLLEQRNAALVTQTKQLENEIRTIATKLATTGAGP
jgi:chromosome segregation ATPase